MPPSVTAAAHAATAVTTAARAAQRLRSGANLHVYRHNDLAHLEALLRDAPPSARKLVVTDSLFSMDGDFADLAGLAALKRRHGFLLVVDEAHATLARGEQGGGAAEEQGVAHEVGDTCIYRVDEEGAAQLAAACQPSAASAANLFYCSIHHARRCLAVHSFLHDAPV